MGLEEINATAVADVFLPIQPFSSLNDLKLPPFISSMRENTSDVLLALLLTSNTALSPVLVEVDVTKSDEPSACGAVYTINEPVTSKTMTMIDFNNILLTDRKISLSIKS